MSNDPKKTLNSSNGVLDEVENGENLTPEQRIKQLTEFIGGFEKWSQLNEDCRLYVVQYLDYKSRCKLERCSKQDQSTVKKTPLHVYSMAILDSDWLPDYSLENPFDIVHVHVQFGKKAKSYRVMFSHSGEYATRNWLTRAAGKELEYSTMVIGKSNYYEEAVKFAEGFMKKGNFELERISMDVSRYPWETSQIRQLPLCKKAGIGVNRLQQPSGCFSILPENMDTMSLYPSGKYADNLPVPSEALDVPQVRTSQSLYIRGGVKYSDDQFLNLRNKSMHFDAIELSDEAINKFLKRWINGKCFEGFEYASLKSINEWNSEMILNGINVTFWDEDFRKEAESICEEVRGFCSEGDTYQISSRVDPYESLTLNIRDLGNGTWKTCHIYHTGRRTTRDGEDFKGYYVDEWW